MENVSCGASICRGRSTDHARRVRRVCRRCALTGIGQIGVTLTKCRRTRLRLSNLFRGRSQAAYGRSAVMLTATTEIFRIAKRPRREPADGLTQAITPQPTATGLSRFGVGSRNGRRLLARRRSHSRTPCETHWNVSHSGNTKSIGPRVSSWLALKQHEDKMTAPDPNTQAGQRFQEKLEFYLVALAFTILGLAAQTAEFGNLVGARLSRVGSLGSTAHIGTDRAG